MIRIENAIPKIIDEEEWERVQKRLSDNKRNAVNKAKRSYLLTGLIECEECGAMYVGHTSTNQKGIEHKTYTCGNKYRTHTCHAKNISANEIETFVVQHLKAYLLETDFKSTAKLIADQINNASKDAEKEKAELADITKKINNGVKAILSGINVPELEDELDRLRIRKSELEDIIAVSNRENKKIDPKDIERVFDESIEKWDDENLPDIIKHNVTKIYARTDGTFTVNVGVHIVGCGGRI